MAEVATAPRNKKLTARDAHVAMLRLQIGLFTTPAGGRLTVENLPFLLALRSKLFAAADATWDEINRIEQEEARRVAREGV